MKAYYHPVKMLPLLMVSITESVVVSAEVVQTAVEYGYGVNVYKCDLDRQPVPSRSIADNDKQGSVHRICFEPNEKAKSDGVGIESIESFIWKRGTSFETVSIRNGNAVGVLNSYSCGVQRSEDEQIQQICYLDTLLGADFYRVQGSVSGVGTAIMTFGKGIVELDFQEGPGNKRGSTSSSTTGNKLLNAYNAPLSALTASNSFYFLEFPLILDDDDSKDDTTKISPQPMCGDGSPYSFVFRRGSNKHISKLIVEFEDGPACMGDNGDVECCEAAAVLQTPWYEYLQQETEERSVDSSGSKLFPPLGSCTGITSGLTIDASNVLFGNNNEFDIPIAVRPPGNSTDNNKEWWEYLSSDIHDWSYILVPHCTMDWHLGHKLEAQEYNTGCDDSGNGNNNNETTTIFHRGGINLQAVLDWVNEQFPSGLDALITTSGGKVGGCLDPQQQPDAAHSSTIAPMLFAEGIAAHNNNGDKQPPPADSMLVVTEGSNLWRNRLPTVDIMKTRWNAMDLLKNGSVSLADTAESMINNAPDAITYAWFASESGNVNSDNNAESKWLTQVKRLNPKSFHVYTPPSVATTASVEGGSSSSEYCPRYTFTKNNMEEEEDLTLSNFFRNLTNVMSWASSSEPSSDDQMNAVTQSKNNNGTSSRITFFSLAIIFFSLAVLVWIVYFVIKFKHKKLNKPVPISPYDLWLIALTHHPRIFLFISLLIPIILSSVGIAKSGVTVNLDFDQYLNISSEVEEVARAYNGAQQVQFESLDIEEYNCALLNGKTSQSRRSSDRVLGSTMIEGEHAPPSTSKQSNRFAGPREEGRSLLYQYWSNGPGIALMYQNRRGGNVFTLEVLEQIRQFEKAIRDFPGFTNYCVASDGKCRQFDSMIPTFFPNDGPLVRDIDGVLRSFSTDPSALWKMDQYFGPDNLQSNVTKSFVWFRNRGDANDFLETLYRDLFWKADQVRPYAYPDLTITWSNKHLESVEAQDALNHDALWSIASLIFIGLMIYLKVRNVFVFLSGVLGLVLSFSTAYYWVSIHFDIQQITLLYVSSLFVMLGIGADDIFLMLDSFEHTKLEYISVASKTGDIENSVEGENLEDRHHEDTSEIIRERMKSAYSTAGGMMMVSSATTAVCFFSNAFGVLVIIQEFGIYMGMVVLINYIHVMTILPSAIMVDELYIKPWRSHRNENESGDVQEQQQRVTEKTPVEESDSSTRSCLASARSNEDTEANTTIQTFRPQTEDSKPQTTIQHDGNAEVIAAISLPLSTHDEDPNGNSDRFDVSPEKNLEASGGTENTSNDIGDEHMLVSERDGEGRISRDTSKMNRMDRWLVEKYSPFLSSRYRLIMFVSVVLALLLGACGIATFSMSGTIVLFSNRYNLGRLQTVTDAYYNNDISKTVESIVRPKFASIGENLGSGNGSPAGGNGGSGGGAPGGSGAPGGIGGAQGGSSGSVPPPYWIDTTITPSSTSSPAPVSAPPQPLTSPPTGRPSETSQTETPTMSPTTQSSSSNTAEGVSDPGLDSDPAPAIAPHQPIDASLTSAPSVMQVNAPQHNTSLSGGTSAPVDSELGQSSLNNEGDSGSASIQCEKPCQNGGTCTPGGKCACFNGWDGSDCTTPVCPVNSANRLVCSGKGGCIRNDNGIPGSTICSCIVGYGGSPDCSQKSQLARREAIVVRLIWGVEVEDDPSTIWMIRHGSSRGDDYTAKSSTLGEEATSFDLSEPHVQEWLYEVVTIARNETELFVQPDRATWIEIFRNFAISQGLTFPVSKDLFVGYLQLLKSIDSNFADMIRGEIGTSSPGLSGDFTFTSITMQADVLTSESTVSASSLDKWSNFIERVNQEKPDNVSKVVAQSRAFLDAYRAEQTVDSTLATWFVANGLCMLIILAFSQNLLLCFMVMVTITLIFLFLGGLLFFVFSLPFGPVEALGVSIFIGLSANYSLHVIHSYHSSNSTTRQVKIEDAIYGVGSPIVASALSSIGGSIFLFGCRTYVFVELGILICTIITLSLLYSMGFLLAWLKTIGPLPCDEGDDDANTGNDDRAQHRRRLHQWDLKALFITLQYKIQPGREESSVEQTTDSESPEPETDEPVESSPSLSSSSSSTTREESSPIDDDKETEPPKHDGTNEPMATECDAH